MFIILFRTLILYMVVLAAIRLMGKSELAKLAPFQMVILFMLAELATLPIENRDLSLINGITAILALTLLQTIISALSLKFEWFKNLINGKPSILIDHGCINEKELKRLRLNINDLSEQLRIKDYPSISDVAYAIMESNGSLSVIPNADCSSVTPKDLSIPKASEEMPLILICDGTLYTSNLTRLGWSEDYFRSLMTNYKLDSYKNVLLAFTDQKKKLHVYPASCGENLSVEVLI